MIAPHHSISEWRQRLKSAGEPINGGCFTDGRRLDGLLAGFGRIGRDRTLESAYASERTDLASKVLPGGRSAVPKRKNAAFRGLSQ